MILALWLGTLAAIRAGTVEEGDPYWQIRAGVENLAGTPLARPDTWSWAPVDALFQPTSPGWNVLLALAWETAGFWGLFAVTFLTIGAYLVVVAGLARSWGARPLPMLMGLVPCYALALPMLSPRATVAAQTLLLGAVAAGLWWSGRARRASPLSNGVVSAAGGLAFSVVGNWIHLSWVLLSVTVAASWLVVWLLTEGLTGARRAILSVAGSVGLAAGVGLGPYGWGALARSQAVQTACAGIIAEWSSMLTPGLALRWLPAGLLAVAGAAVSAWWVVKLRRGPGTRDARLRGVAALTVIALPAAMGGFLAIRFIGIALLLLAPVAGMGATLLTDRLRARFAAHPPRGWWGARRMTWTSGTSWRVVLVSVMAALSPGTALLVMPHGQPPAMNAISQLPAGCRLYSLQHTGSAVILLRPDVRVWIDGRADYYGRSRLLDAFTYLTDPALAQPVPPGATCILLPDRFGELELDRLHGLLDADVRWRSMGRIDGLTLWVLAGE